MNVVSLFDGISCGQLALQRANIKVDKYFASEIDRNAIAITKNHFPNTIHIGNVSKIKYENGTLFTENGNFDVGTVDLFIGGSPCTNFSFAGKRNGCSTESGIEVYTLEDYLQLKEDGFTFQGQSYLFFEYLRLLKEINPKYFLLENVRMHKKWQDVISKNLGVEPLKINSNLVSAQNRPRLYWSNLVPDKIEDKKIYIKDILTNFSDSEYYWLSKERMNKIINREYKFISMYRVLSLENKSGCVMTLRHSSDDNKIKIFNKTSTVLSEGFRNSSDNKIEINNRIRYLTNEENERLQTLPYGYTSGLSECKRKKAIGNCWTVDVIVEFFKKIGQPILVQDDLLKQE